MFDKLDTKKTSELYLLRQGWISPRYELTDKVNTYGKITYRRSPMHKATAVTAANVWIFQRGSFFTRSILINDQNGVAIGTAITEWFSRRTKLTLESGFSAEFYRPLFFSFDHIWESEGYGKIVQIKGRAFGPTKSIYIDQSNTPVNLIPLLIFLGAYLVILRKRRQVAMVGNLLAIFGGSFRAVPIVNAGPYQ